MIASLLLKMHKVFLIQWMLEVAIQWQKELLKRSATIMLKNMAHTQKLHV